MPKHLSNRKARVERGNNLWGKVLKEREQQRACDNYPVRAGLESAWELLEIYYKGIIKRGDVGKVSNTPLDALLYYIEVGFYPPPEIMLAVLNCYEDYVMAGGEMSLEEAFLGPPRPKGGNRAYQNFTRSKYATWDRAINKLTKEGYTKAKAAEILSDRMGGAYEPETILRMVNKHDILGKIKRKFQKTKRTKKTP